jgi:hypothetical protein
MRVAARVSLRGSMRVRARADAEGDGGATLPPAAAGVDAAGGNGGRAQRAVHPRLLLHLRGAPGVRGGHPPGWGPRLWIVGTLLKCLLNFKESY